LVFLSVSFDFVRAALAPGFSPSSSHSTVPFFADFFCPYPRFRRHRIPSPKTSLATYPFQPRGSSAPLCTRRTFFGQTRFASTPPVSLLSRACQPISSPQNSCSFLSNHLPHPILKRHSPLPWANFCFRLGSPQWGWVCPKISSSPLPFEIRFVWANGLLVFSFSSNRSLCNKLLPLSSTYRVPFPMEPEILPLPMFQVSSTFTWLFSSRSRFPPHHRPLFAYPQPNHPG